MGKELTKPMSVARADFIQDLTGLINHSGLPLFVVEPILKDFYRDVSALAKQQADRDREQYLEQLADRAAAEEQKP